MVHMLAVLPEVEVQAVVSLFGIRLGGAPAGAGRCQGYR
jgi:hypothetical protein